MLFLAWPFWAWHWLRLVSHSSASEYSPYSSCRLVLSYWPLRRRSFSSIRHPSRSRRRNRSFHNRIHRASHRLETNSVYSCSIRVRRSQRRRNLTHLRLRSTHQQAPYCTTCHRFSHTDRLLETAQSLLLILCRVQFIDAGPRRTLGLRLPPFGATLRC